MPLVGQPMDRVDGRLKTTGAAPYAAEFTVKNMAYGVTVQSTIAAGEITSIDTTKARSAPGVLGVFTHENMPKLKMPRGAGSETSSFRLGEKGLMPLQGTRIYYDGQHIALVVAETFEQAEHAALLVEVAYEKKRPVAGWESALETAYHPKESMGRPLQSEHGQVDQAWENAPVKWSQTYSTPALHHNPMEPHATMAVWRDEDLTVYDSTQSVLGNRDAVAAILGISPKHVRLISLYVGGGFGCKGFTWPHTLLAPIAAHRVGRPVKIVLTRQQMFTCNGHRAPTVQRIALGAEKNGRLVSVEHEVLTETSFVDEFVETAALPTQNLYACPNIRIAHKMVRVNRGTPTPMRAPGEAPGTFAIESALDELAYQLKMDPLDLRLMNYAENDPHTDKPWSLKNLRECYERGAAAIGWAQRQPQPGAMAEGNQLVGYGMATAIYPANRTPASAKVRIFSDGHAEASSCTQDIGTGTYTIMTQIAADALGLPADKVRFKLGDSALPKAPVSGGSQTAASVGPAVKDAATEARNKVLRLAFSHRRSPLSGQVLENITVENGRCFVTGDPARGETYGEILRRSEQEFVENESTAEGTTREGGKHKLAHSYHSFGAQFVRVLVDPLLGTVRVTNCAAVMDVGKVLNLKMARNQIMGGMLFGIGMALMEATIYDPNNGRVVTRDLAQYLVPVHADTPEMDVQFIDQPDPYITSIGARGVGEIGITGIAAAVANAVYHATGTRIRDLPITTDKFFGKA